MQRAGKFFVILGLSLVILISLLTWKLFQVQEKQPFLHIPIIFSHGKPCVHVDIEGNKYLFHLDSGAFDCFATHKPEVIEKIKHKTSLDPTTWFDFKGNSYLSPTFEVKKICIETFKIYNATILEENPSFILNGSYSNSSNNSFCENNTELEEISGRIGIQILKVLDYWLIDFPKSSIFAIRDIEKIEQIPGFSFEGFIEVPLETIRSHAALAIETDFGIKKFILDTGASRSVMAPPSEQYLNHQLLKTNRFSIGNYDLGETELYLFHLTKDFLCDGFLGRDFFQKHAIYLDFKKNRAWIQVTKTNPKDAIAA